MSPERTNPKELPERFTFYRDVINVFEKNNIGYGIIGGFGQYFYGSGREPTYDLDIAIEPNHVDNALNKLTKAHNWKIEYKHPDWLNQVWSSKNPSDYPAYSVDIVHRHSTGLIEVKPWWIKRGTHGQLAESNPNFAAPEAIALSKVLLWSRRSHDIVDAVQVAYRSAKAFRSFDWNLLLDELHSDWRLGYSLAALTEMLYGKESINTLPKSIKDRLHSSFTENPIPGPVRGHIFAYDTHGEAGKIETWKNATNPIMVSSESSTQSVLNDLYVWHENHAAMIDASRKIVGQGRNFDWDKLIVDVGDNWRLALCLMLYTEVLYGETGSNIIPQKVRKDLSGRFLNSSPDKELGTKLFPYRF